MLRPQSNTFERSTVSSITLSLQTKKMDKYFVKNRQRMVLNQSLHGRVSWLLNQNLLRQKPNPHKKAHCCGEILLNQVHAHMRYSNQQY